MEIRYLADHPEHVSTLAEWFHAEWGFLLPGSTVESFVERFRTHMSRDALPLTLVAREGAELLGTASLREHDMHTRRELSPWLGGVYIREDLRGRGIGGALVRAVEGVARARGHREMYLYALADREGYYRRLGWRLLEHTEYNGEPVIIMRTEL